ncbi:MAG: YifB family Mg chelatase-like AAA ATPase [Clostridia bacterium]|jgi:magnesium chelatase family protein
MLSKVKSCGLIGIDGYVIEVETDISSGIPAVDIVGLGDIAVRESRERVKSAIKNSGFEFPTRKITINLAPANMRKEGSSLDLPIAMGILAASGQIDITHIDEYIFLGELSLDGSVKSVNGVLSMALCANEHGIKSVVLPHENADEAAIVREIEVLPINNLTEIAQHINGLKKLNIHTVNIEAIMNETGIFNIDFADVKGQTNVKRALEVAAAGAHNCIMIGSPGSGKSMIAKRLPGILPSMTFEEAIEVTKIHSISGKLPGRTSLMTTRPFRSPHHTISDISLIGGGRIPKPGEISLANYGVLFLDEVPEFSKEALEVLRQPLEDGIVTVSRINSSIRYPAKTMLVLAANPCRCGNYLDPDKLCTCTSRQVQQYMGKISGPLLDRLDIHIEVSSVKFNELQNIKAEENSKSIRERVNKARNIQINRYKGLNIYANSQLEPSMLNKFCRIDDKSRGLLRSAFEKLGLSARAHSRILKVSRTIADIDGSEEIKLVHIAEAIQYRSLDRRFIEK